MNDPAIQHLNKPIKRWQFSLGSIATWTAIACLTVSVLMINRQLASLGREMAVLTQEIESSRPLPINEVADHFEKRTTLGPIKTTVRDVRYSPEKDAYQVEFSWTDSNTGKNLHGAVELTSNDYGKYWGQIRNDPFVEPLGFENGFPVVVESPSAFER